MSISLGRLAIASCALSIAAAVPTARADLVYNFVCQDVPACHGDASFRASFTFNAASASALANQTFTAADARYVGWSYTTSYGSYSASGSAFPFRALSDIQFRFDATGTAIEDLVDLLGTTISIGPSTSRFIAFKEGEFSNYYLDRQQFDSSTNLNTVPGDFVLQVTTSEPVSLALLGMGFAGLVAARRRRPR